VLPVPRTTIAVAAVGAAFVAGLSMGRGDAPVVGDPVRLVNADLRQSTSCDQLLRWYVDHGVARVTPWGWDVSRIYTLDDVAAPGAARTESAPLPAPAGAPVSGTGTNVQETGVDEPDIVKTDGRLLVRIAQDGSLAVYDVTGDEPELVGSLALPGFESPELLLAGDRVVVVGRVGSGTRVEVVDISEPSAPAMVRTSTYDSSYVTARQHGDVVRLVISAALPQLDFVQPGMLPSGRDGEHTSVRRNQDVVRASTIDDWLPRVTAVDADGRTSTSRAVDCEDVSIPGHDAGLGTVAVVGFDVASPGDTDVTAVATPSETVYTSLDHLYLASSAYRLGWQTCCWDVPQPPTPSSPTGNSSGGDDGTTYLYDFDLAGTATRYAASGSVVGTVADRWAMDESGGVLRVAVGPTTRADLGNAVVTLSRSGSDLVELGRVDGLGVGEQIKAMRWFDGLAVMVTFRQTDPFYAIDLTDPSAPRLLGELKIPGYSSYLHPLGDHRMIGIGSAADPETGMVAGAKASLFDVHDVTAPRELGTVEYGAGTSPQAELDPRQFTWLPDRRTALTVIANWTTGTSFVSVLQVSDSSISNRMVPLDRSDDVSRVRLVPLPDGRVVLSTGSGVSFFPAS
jgi:uncharacterized secreted protein with C-terminal beta-propeller domain